MKSNEEEKDVVKSAAVANGIRQLEIELKDHFNFLFLETRTDSSP